MSFFPRVLAGIAGAQSVVAVSACGRYGVSGHTSAQMGT
jgi:hypothetical protein